jgi:hypothetical protein
MEIRSLILLAPQGAKWMDDDVGFFHIFVCCCVCGGLHFPYIREDKSLVLRGAFFLDNRRVRHNNEFSSSGFIFI